MKKLILLTIVSCFLLAPAISQDADIEKYLRRREGVKYPNILKINTVALVFNNVSLVYERALVPRFSFILGVGYKYSGDIPKLFTLGSDQIEFSIDPITGFSISPEFRYYLKNCDNRFLDGFYVGLYFRYTGYNTYADFIYYPDNEQPDELYRAKIGMTEYGAGISLGYQLLLWERLSLDFMLFGPRFSNYHMLYEFEQVPSQEFLDELSTSINDLIDKFGFEYNVELKQEGETRASNTFSFANVRFGLSLGFAF